MIIDTRKSTWGKQMNNTVTIVPYSIFNQRELMVIATTKNGEWIAEPNVASYVTGKRKPHFPVPACATNGDIATGWIMLKCAYPGCQMCRDDWNDTMEWICEEVERS